MRVSLVVALALGACTSAPDTQLFVSLLDTPAGEGEFPGFFITVRNDGAVEWAQGPGYLGWTPLPPLSSKRVGELKHAFASANFLELVHESSCDWTDGICESITFSDGRRKRSIVRDVGLRLPDSPPDPLDALTLEFRRIVGVEQGQ